MSDLAHKFPFNRIFALTFLVWGLVTAFLFFNTRGTYDSGDSIGHYVIAAFSFNYPELFLDHWGKPFFTLLASIPAQWGIYGIKLFNIAMILTAGLATRKIALRLTPQVAPFAFLFVVAMPEIFSAQFSGLTEPLFAALLAVSAYLALKGRFAHAFLAVSFLPFVRTEGFLLLPVFALFAFEKWLSARRQMGARSSLNGMPFVKFLGLLALLATGTVLYSLLGGIFKGDLLWIFSQNPYQSHLENYGVGNWTHFTKGFIFITGVPLYGLWILGILAGLLALLQYLIPSRSLPGVLKILAWKSSEWRLIYGLFLAYFGAHTVFWATGLAHSMGMLRVLIALAPVAALICLRSFQALAAPMRKWPMAWRLFTGAVALYVFVFPVTGNHASLRMADFEPTADQLMLEDMWVDHMQITTTYNNRFYSAHPYTALAFFGDPWDNIPDLSGAPLDNMPPNSYIVWDSWFGLVESGIPEQYWTENADKFELIQEYNGENREGKPIKMMFLRAIPTHNNQ